MAGRVIAGVAAGSLVQVTVPPRGGYAADVFAMEDWLLPDRPVSIPDWLMRHPRTLFTPHLGSAVDNVHRSMSLQAARQVRQVLDGRPPDHAVNQLIGVFRSGTPS